MPDTPHIPQSDRDTLIITDPTIVAKKFHTDILYIATLWHNGAIFVHNNRAYTIGLTPPPDLQTLLDVDNHRWAAYYLPALHELHDLGYLEDVTIHRRTIKYGLTHAGQQKANELFHTKINTADAIPTRLRRKISSGEALVGDRYEKLTHRTMVATAAYAYDEFATHDYDHIDTFRYPSSTDGPSPDLTIIYFDGENPRKIDIEALTNHHDTDMVKRKYQHFTHAVPHPNADLETIIIGETAPHLASILNTLHTDPDTNCTLPNFPLQNPDNYRLPTLRDYLDRAHNNSDYAAPGLTNITTLTALYRDGLDNEKVNKKQKQLAETYPDPA